MKREIEIIKPTYNDEIELWIKADWNDADYVYSTNFITSEQFTKLLPLLKHFKTHNDYEGFDLDEWNEEWNEGEEISKKTFETFEYSLPYGDGDIHTICEIKAWFLSKDDSIRYIIKI